MEEQQKIEIELAELETSVDTLLELLRLSNVIDYDEMKLIISKDIIRLNQVDPAHVMMLYSDNLMGMISINKFEEQCILQSGGVDSKGTTYLIAVLDDPKEWMKFLMVYKKRNGDKNIKIRLTNRFITMGSTRKENNNFLGEEKPLFFRLERKMKTVYDSTYYIPKVPTLKLNTRFRMNLQELYDYLKLCKYTDYITLSFIDEMLEVKSDVGEDGNLNAIISPDEISGKIDSKALYPLDYIYNVAKTIKKEEVWISFNTDYPIKIEFTPFHDDIIFTYLLAPRIESQ